MASLNKVFLAGNLTQDPELRYTPSGAAVADINLAVNRTYLTKSGEQKKEVCYVRIVVWGKQAQSCAQYLSKGTPILVEGRLQLDSWETKEGEKRNQLKVQAERVQFLGRGKADADYGTSFGAGPKSDADMLDSGIDPDDDIPF